MKYNYILIDTPIDDNWKFRLQLEEMTGLKFDVISSNTHNMHGKISKWGRYFSYFILPLKLLKIRNNINVIVSWQQFYGLLYAFWLRVFHLAKKNKLIIMTFIYKEKRGIIGFLYKKFIKYIVSSIYIDTFLCFSEKEIIEYSRILGIHMTRLSTCNLTVDDIAKSYENRLCDDGYFLAAGRSNRDYIYLCSELKNSKYKVIILCDDYCVPNVSSNIEFRKNIYGNSYYELLAKCKGTIIPLKKDIISAGQLAIIQSMMFGKTCIVTRTDTTEEYVKNYKTGIFIDNKPGELYNLLSQIKDRQLYDIGVNARNEYLLRFSGKTLVKKVSSLV